MEKAYGNTSQLAYLMLLVNIQTRSTLNSVCDVVRFDGELLAASSNADVYVKWHEEDEGQGQDPWTN